MSDQESTVKAAPDAHPESPARQRRLESLGRLRRARRRTFYSIGEVCAMVGVKPHVLRYWETQFRELSPTKNRSGNRVYQAGEIELIALIHKLVHEERYTVEGARRRISELRDAGTVVDESTQALQRVFLRTLQSELHDLHELLNPAAG
jgi:DNA-binding transcriptional MerR regulator